MKRLVKHTCYEADGPDRNRYHQWSGPACAIGGRLESIFEGERLDRAQFQQFWRSIHHSELDEAIHELTNMNRLDSKLTAHDRHDRQPRELLENRENAFWLVSVNEPWTNNNFVSLVEHAFDVPLAPPVGIQRSWSGGLARHKNESVTATIVPKASDLLYDQPRSLVIAFDGAFSSAY